jgi:hypothetical protein
MDKIVKYSTVISASLIYIGFLRLQFYYSNFGISINEYLELAEIITSFLDDLGIIIIIVLVSVFNMFFFTNITHVLLNRKKDNKINIETTERIIGIVYGSKQMIIWTLFSSLGLAIICYFLVIYYDYSYFLIYFFTLTSLNFATSFFELLRKDEDKFQNTVINLSIILLASFLLAMSLGNKEHNITLSKNHNGYRIDTEDKIYFLGEDDKFIGRTKNYVFIQYNGKTKIISQSQVKSIEIPSH